MLCALFAQVAGHPKVFALVLEFVQAFIQEGKDHNDQRAGLVNASFAENHHHSMNHVKVLCNASLGYLQASAWGQVWTISLNLLLP